ncbi:MAG: response regulator [Deltaproteobacteria bacterium]|nr:MAG: response regulator [Deltaproteobacteria bacterium]
MNREQVLEQVYKHLSTEFRINFSHYKDNTVMRRVEHRMTLLQLDSKEEYLQRLAFDRNERDELYEDLLIGVTCFFRDKSAFAILEEQILPELLEQANDGETIRIWVAGCASGEEAYSLAILCHELLAGIHRPIDVRIFATDAHKHSLQLASIGMYPASALKEMSPERKKRHFIAQGERYKIAKHIRRMIVFAPHNILSDPPFTQIHMVSCRNLLIYLEAKAQQQIQNLFHFALQNSGVLILGPSERLNGLEDEFDTISDRWKIFRKKREAKFGLEKGFRLFNKSEETGAQGHHRLMDRKRDLEPISPFYERLLEQHLPPSLLVDENLNILHMFGGVERFLELQTGRITTHVLRLIHEELRGTLSRALEQVRHEHTVYRQTGLRVQTSEGIEQIQMLVQTITDPVKHDVRYLIKLERTIRSTPDEGGEEANQVQQTEYIRALEQELQYTKDSLRATVAELSAVNSELQSTNEELITANEELQSTNEEFHSVNEELYAITVEHQQKIEELSQANNDIDNLLAVTRVGVLFLDESLCIRRYTSEIAKTLELQPHDIGRRFDSFRRPLISAQFVDTLRKVARDLQPDEVEVHDENGHPYMVSIWPYESKDKVEGLVLSLVDIKMLKEAQERLNQYAGVVENARDLIGVFDTSLNIQQLNPAARNLLGLGEDYRFQSLTMQDLHPAWAYHIILEEGIPTARNEGVWKGETAILTRSGTEIPVLQSILAYYSEDKVYNFSTIMRDIGVQKETEKRLRNAEQRANAANQAKTAFLAHISHELRTPLSAILGFADILKQRLSQVPFSQEDAGHAIGVVQRNGHYLLELVNDILDLSKIEAEEMEIRQTLQPLYQQIQELETLVQMRANEKGLPLHFIYNSKLPAEIITDRVRLRQILLNLLSNAIKFTDEGSVEFHVECLYNESFEAELPDEIKSILRPYKPGEVHPELSVDAPLLLHFLVRDTGIGMSEKFQEKLFRPFTQADEAVHFGGTGLGLSISKRLAEKLDGAITWESELGEGSSFSFWLPTSRLETDWLTPNQQQHYKHVKEPKTAIPQFTAYVLVVDDLPEIQQVTQHVLEQSGINVTLASHGEEAIQLVEEAEQKGQPFDLILMDMQMPIMNGYETTQRLRHKGYDIPIIALTAGAMKGDREKCIQVGCNDYLSKPIKTKKLLHLMSSYLHQQKERTSEATPPTASSVRAKTPTHNKNSATTDKDSTKEAAPSNLELLLVEDSPDLLRYYATGLHGEGYKIHTAQNASLALQAAERRSFDVFLLDMSLPDLDGLSLYQQLKELQPQARYFAISGNIDEDFQQQILNVGFERFFLKPVEIQTIHHQISISSLS